MRAVIISIHPKWCEKIASGEKTVELRKTRPKTNLPFKCYVYCTKDGYAGIFSGKPFLSHNRYVCNGKVIGEFVCDSILSHCEMANADIAEITSCVRREDIRKYSDGKEVFGWHISDLKIYDKPKELSEFKPCHQCEYVEGCRTYVEHRLDGDCRKPILRPPQSWCYVEELEG